MQQGHPMAGPGAVAPLDVVAAITAALAMVLEGPVRIRSIQPLAAQVPGPVPVPTGPWAAAPGSWVAQAAPSPWAAPPAPGPWALAGRMDQHLSRRDFARRR